MYGNLVPNRQYSSLPKVIWDPMAKFNFSHYYLIEGQRKIAWVTMAAIFQRILDLSIIGADPGGV